MPLICRTLILSVSLIKGCCTTCETESRRVLTHDIAAVERLPITIDVPGSTHSMTFVPVTLANGATLMFGTTEVTWDMYDLFVYGEDEPNDHPAHDAITKPTKPYIAMDRGFGRAGYPAISMSYLNALTFCEWLSARTGRTFRLPTVDEWREACAQGGASGDLDNTAWHAGNSGAQTHPVGTRTPCRLGLFDMLGNAAEWATDHDGSGVVLGGSFRDHPEHMTCNLSVAPTYGWNASDPQFPQSRWWLADAPFVGLRIVMVK